MNSTCPTCGALYNVASKDIGRKLKCKKCGAALKVTDAGLELDAAPAAGTGSKPAPVPASVDDDRDDRDRDRDDRDDEPVVKKKKGSASRGGGVSLDPLALLAKIGGLATIPFAFGAFLVIVYLFMPLISAAAELRAEGGIDRLKHKQEVEKRKALPKGKTTEQELNAEEAKKYQEELEKMKLPEKYAPLYQDARDNLADEQISRKRTLWFDRYGMMAGFIFLMIGSLGYVIQSEASIRRTVGAIILCAQMLIIFSMFGAGGCVNTAADSIKTIAK
jgi:predicted Zn finger-like uncharacterized protein